MEVMVHVVRQGEGISDTQMLFQYLVQLHQIEMTMVAASEVAFST